MNDLIPTTAARDKIVESHSHEVYGGQQVQLRFANDYGVSVISHRGSYGTELAVLHGFSKPVPFGLAQDEDGYFANRDLCYGSPITVDVVKNIPDEAALATIVEQVAALPANPDCTHERPADWHKQLDEGPIEYLMDAMDSMAKMGGGR